MSSWHEEARQLRSEGWKLIDIGKRFGVTRERVRQVTNGIVCPIKHRGGNPAGYITAIQRWRKENPKWSPEQDDYIRSFYKRGKSASQIGAHLGATRSAVVGRAHRLGLSK